jgi:hypothetical protein
VILLLVESKWNGGGCFYLPASKVLPRVQSVADDSSAITIFSLECRIVFFFAHSFGLVFDSFPLLFSTGRLAGEFPYKQICTTHILDASGNEVIVHTAEGQGGAVFPPAQPEAPPIGTITAVTVPTNMDASAVNINPVVVPSNLPPPLPIMVNTLAPVPASPPPPIVNTVPIPYPLTDNTVDTTTNRHRPNVEHNCKCQCFVGCCCLFAETTNILICP